MFMHAEYMHRYVEKNIEMRLPFHTESGRSYVRYYLVCHVHNYI